MSEQEQPQAPQSYIQILFREPGNVMYDIRASGVTPGQFFAASHVLRMMGEMGFVREQQEKAQQMQRNKITVPGADFDPNTFV